MSDLVSVIIPIYNVEKYLEQCLDSLINQTYRNWEAILVDDGSTDRSGDICDLYKSRDKRFKVIHQKNKRIGAARNAGLNIATGDYITFLDSDDYLNSNTYADALEILQRNDADVIQWDVNDFIDGESNSHVVEPAPYELVLDTQGAIECLLDGHVKGRDPHFTLLFNNCRCVWTKMCNAKIFDEIRFPESREYEDDYIVHKIFDAADRIVFSNRRFSNYRKWSGSTLHNMPLKGRLDKVQLEYERMLFVETYGNTHLTNLAVHNYFIGLLNCYVLKECSREQKKVLRKQFLNDYKMYISKCSFKDKLVLTSFRLCPSLFSVLLRKHRGIS